MLFSFLLLAGLGCSLGLDLTRVDEPVPGEYVIQFKDNLAEKELTGHMKQVMEAGEVLFEYKHLVMFRGYSARLDGDALAMVLNSELVQRVEQNGVMRISQGCTDQAGATWGLVRTSQRALNTQSPYTYESNLGAGVNTYVIDTGIKIEHNEFEGRAIFGANFALGPDDDGNGHGTHCAGTMVGATYGLCKHCDVYAVRVMNALGFGTIANIIAGVDWVANHHTMSRAKNSTKAGLGVANMSLGGGYSAALNLAVESGIKAGVVFVAAAGNDGRDACNYSPASVTTAITVMASDNTDRSASWSNFGSCGDIWAPGVSITSAWIGSNDATNTISGTSMAAPHAAGVAAKLIAQNPTVTDAEAIKTMMNRMSSPGLISNPGVGSPNQLLNHMCPL